jgi:hypothetical protein
MLTMIAVFLFTRRFRQYAILRVKPTAYGIPFSALCHGDYVLWAELWFVVLCRCVKERVRQNYSENYFDVGIMPVEISCAGPTTTVIFLVFLTFGRLLLRALGYVSPGKFKFFESAGILSLALMNKN